MGPTARRPSKTRFLPRKKPAERVRAGGRVRMRVRVRVRVRVRARTVAMDPYP